MARYVKIGLSKEEKELKERRLKALDLEQQILDARRAGNVAAIEELTKEWQSLAVAPLMLIGDKEHLQYYMDWMTVKTATDNARYAKLFKSLVDLEDGQLWSVDADDWKWLKDNLEKVDLSQKTPKNEIIFHPALRRRLATVFMAIEAATQTAEN